MYMHVYTYIFLSIIITLLQVTGYARVSVILCDTCPCSADPLSNISGKLTFNSSEEAIAFAVKNGKLSTCISHSCMMVYS